MNYLLYINKPSSLVTTITYPYAGAITGDISDTVLCIAYTTETPLEPLSGRLYWKDSELRTMAERPSDNHTFSISAEEWEITPYTISVLKYRLVQQVEATRVEKTNAPIDCGGITIDADPTSRENINGKIVEITSKLALDMSDAAMFWKDTSNVIHTWDTMEDYLLWLRGVAIAMAERTTALYGVAWGHKDAINALTEADDVINYDISEGW